MPFKATAKYPATIVGVADLGNLTDYIAGTTKPSLAGAITNSVTSFSVATGTGATLPTDNFCITIDSEEMFVVTRSTDALSSITRGINGTTAASHLIGAPVNQFITANLINQLAAEANALETFSVSRFSPDRPPASANAMDDEFDGAAIAGTWSTVNFTSATNTVANGYLTLHSPGIGSHNVQMIVQTLPSAPWGFTTKAEINAIPSSTAGHRAGLVLRESATGKLITLDLFTGLYGSGPFGFGIEIDINSWTSPTVLNTNLAFSWAVSYASQYFKITLTSTTLTFWISGFGNGWLPIYTEAITAHFTTAPNQIGLYAESNDSNSTDGIFSFFRRVV
jgi:hypothetical protein